MGPGGGGRLGEQTQEPSLGSHPLAPGLPSPRHLGSEGPVTLCPTTGHPKRTQVFLRTLCEVSHLTFPETIRQALFASPISRMRRLRHGKGRAQLELAELAFDARLGCSAQDLGS